MTDLNKLQEAIDAVHKYGGIRKASRALDVPYTTMHKRYSAAEERGMQPKASGRVHIPERKSFTTPGRFIFTSAQSNTYVNREVWDNLQALAEHYNAKICVSTFTYDLSSYRASSVKRGKEKAKTELWYDPAIEPYIVDESVKVAPGLIWCGELNILPTAVHPLSGFESYTGRASGIFPHAKIAMISIPSSKYEPTKFNYTTGTVTKRNYIAKTAGFKAEFHHAYGGLLVEVDKDGDWFCRQLNADKNNVIYDLTLKAENGKVTDGHRVKAINWGDIHVGTIPDRIFEANWGEGGIFDTLRPEYQFMHDILDFNVRNHHSIRNHHSRYEKYISGRDSVANEIRQVVDFLLKTYRPASTETIIVDSNHDNAFERWLREADYRLDPANAVFFLEAQLAKYKAITYKYKNFHLLEWAVRTEWNKGGLKVRFLRPDESFIICRDYGGGIECGLHGHHGANGGKGSLRLFSKLGRKHNIGHTHSVGIENGAYCAGITGDLDQGYNMGPSSWSHGHIVTYQNGKRAILNVWRGKWKASLIKA